MANFFAKYKNGNPFNLTVIFLVAAAVVLPMALMGMPDGEDLPQHLQFAETYRLAFSKGDFFPGWGVEDNFGYGSIGVRIYPPVPYYPLTLVRMITGTWYDAFWTTILAWTFLGCFGIYLWAKEYVSPTAATGAAALYAIMPYHLSDTYQTWNYAEFAATAVLPFCFLYLTRVCRHKRWRDALFFSISYALLIVLHIPSTVIGSITLAVFGLFWIEWREYKKTLALLFSSGVLALAATAFHWTRIVSEIGWIAVNTGEFSAGYFDYSTYLFPIFLSSDRYSRQLLWFYDTTIVLTVLCLVPASIYLFSKLKDESARHRKLVLSTTVTGFLIFFIMSLPSAFIWKNAAFLQKIQFPWRWLTILSVLAAMSLAVAVSRLSLLRGNQKRAYAYGVLTLVLVISIFNITQSIIPSVPLTKAEFESRLTTSYDKHGNLAWWTVWAKYPAVKTNEKVLTGGRAASISVWDGNNKEFTIEPGEPTEARVAVFYYPHWRAEVNGNPVNARPDENGAILILIPAQESRVKLYFQEPSAVLAGRAISLLTWALIALALLAIYRSGGRRRAELSEIN